jgi:hypothetical protein
MSLVIGGAALAVLLVGVVALTAARLATARRELHELADRITLLEGRIQQLREARPPVDDYLVAEALPLLRPADADIEEAAPVPDQLVLSATIGEPLVKAAAFGHGLRRALGAQSRNRIWFEVRREVRRARKQRRQEMRTAYRRMQQAGEL